MYYYKVPIHLIWIQGHPLPRSIFDRSILSITRLGLYGKSALRKDISFMANSPLSTTVQLGRYVHKTFGLFKGHKVEPEAKKSNRLCSSSTGFTLQICCRFDRWISQGSFIRGAFGSKVRHNNNKLYQSSGLSIPNVTETSKGSRNGLLWWSWQCWLPRIYLFMTLRSSLKNGVVNRASESIRVVMENELSRPYSMNWWFTFEENRIA